MVKICKRIAENETFQSLILTLIFLSGASMGMEAVPELAFRYELFFDVFFTFAQIVFAFEIVVRLGAHSPKFGKFFKDSWNVFDFVIVVMSFVPGVGTLSFIARLFRVFRVLRILSASDHLRGFMDRLKTTADELVYSAVLVLVISYIFTVIGHSSFSTYDPAHWGTLGQSFLSVFYLCLFQNVPGFVEPLVAKSLISLLYFGALYFLLVSLLISVIVAATLQGVKEK